MSESATNVRSPHHVRGIVTMLFSTLCFMVSVLLIRATASVQAVDTWTMSAVRFAIGIAVIVLAYWKEVSFAGVFTKWKLAGRGIVGGIGVALYYLAVVHIGAGRTTFINNTYIAMAGLAAVWLLKERMSAALVIGAGIALTGLALLTNPLGRASHAGIYDLLAIVTAFGSAYVVLTIRMLHAEGEHTSTIFAAQCVYGLAICAAPSLLHLQAISPRAWAFMLGSGVTAALGQLAMTQGFRDLPVAEGSLLQIITPLGIAVGGVWFFHEHFAVHEIIGGALILAGTAFTVARH